MPAVVPVRTPIRFRLTTDPPGVAVWLDQAALGQTPLDGLDLVPPGEHTLRLVLAGYDDDTRVITGGAPLDLTVIMHPLLVHTLPPTPGQPPRPPPPKTNFWPLAGPSFPKAKTSSVAKTSP
jgi:hypothetical protein